MSTHAATSALQHAADFTNSVEGTPKGTPSRFAPKPSGQHATASYQIAAPKSDGGMNDKNDPEGTGRGLKWNADQIHAVEGK